MEYRSRRDPRFSVVIGKKPRDQILPAMPIRIVYMNFERDYVREIRNGEDWFKLQIPEESTPGWELESNWDAFKLRSAFENLKRPKEAWYFLNVTGTFRGERKSSEEGNLISWRELQGWQEVIKILQLRDESAWFPLLGTRSSGNKKSFNTMLANAGLESYSKQIWNVAEETYFWLQGIPDGLSIRRDMYLSREEMEQIFSLSGARIRGSRAWQQAQEVLARRREDRARGNSQGRQKLIAEVIAGSTLNAILATVYVDKLRGKELRVCALKDCDEIFEKQSEHGQKYCSQAHAHLASVRRTRAAKREAKT